MGSAAAVQLLGCVLISLLLAKWYSCKAEYTVCVSLAGTHSAALCCRAEQPEVLTQVLQRCLGQRQVHMRRPLPCQSLTLTWSRALQGRLMRSLPGCSSSNHQQVGSEF